ncbi:hypothetical protein [Ulvibacterium sp.]|uniref:hypothetical protein n=1 Tax=Ulvibacterium sp. TaxID=2665914 RepID=UPI003CC5DC78
MKITYPTHFLQLLFALFSIWSPCLIFGQISEGDPSTYAWFDDMIGQTNSGIFEGVAYAEEFRAINDEHQFFKEPYFVLGSVIYDGEPYFEVNLRYDVYTDQLSIKNEKLSRLPITVLDKEKVAEFQIDQHQFKHLSGKETKENISGFFEILLEKDSLSLFKKHRKKRFKRTDEEVLYYEFKDGYTYYLRLGLDFYVLKKANDLNGIFPKYKKEVKALRNRYASLGKSDTDAYMKSILLDLSALISNQSDKGSL